MLKENPPPSLREVYARLGITRAISYGNFPEIHRAISARHQEFERQAKSAHRAALRSSGHLLSTHQPAPGVRHLSHPRETRDGAAA